MNNLRSYLAACALLAWSCAASSAPVAQWELGVVLTRTPDLANGEKLYQACAACHGVKGEGASDGSVPAIAGQSYTVVAKQIVDFRAGVRSDSRMEHSIDRRHLSFSQPVADVSLYISRMKPTAPPPDSIPAGANVGHGAMAYERTCARCHGELAEGKEDTLAPRLAGQHYAYLIKQLTAASDGSRRTLIESHSSFEKTLGRNELESVAAYLTGLGP